MTIRPGPAIMPIEGGSAILIAFYNQVMTMAAAKMLTATRHGLSGVDFGNNVFHLDFAIVASGPTQVFMEWNVVYWFAAYMQALARMGFTSIGSMEWRHESGTVMDVVLRLLVDMPVRDRIGGGS